MDIHTLVQTPENLRDDKWESSFLVALTESSLTLLSADPIEGPDGWPYLAAETNTDSTESAQKILAWLSKRGIGLVINPRKEYPDYVLSYGMIWSFRETGYFFKPGPSIEVGKRVFSPKAIALSGPPSEAYLPEYVKLILRDFFRDQGVIDPRVLVLSEDQKSFDLAISVESLKNPPESEWPGIAEAVGWFLPPHYSIMIISEVGLPKFSPL